MRCAGEELRGVVASVVLALECRRCEGAEIGARHGGEVLRHLKASIVWGDGG